MPDGGLGSVGIGGQTFPALALNADFRPLSCFPLSLWCWQDAVKAVFLDRVAVFNEYGTEVRSPTLPTRLPSLVAPKDSIPAARVPRSRGGRTTWANSPPAEDTVCVWDQELRDTLRSVLSAWDVVKPSAPVCGVA